MTDERMHERLSQITAIILDLKPSLHSRGGLFSAAFRFGNAIQLLLIALGKVGKTRPREIVAKARNKGAKCRAWLFYVREVGLGI